MPSVHIEKGILKGIELEVWDTAKLLEFARSEQPGVLNRVSFYDSELQRVVFRGIKFTECSFARSRFVSITFRRCTFHKVDLTRTRFLDCHFSDCTFDDCDPYNPSFLRTVVKPSAFKNCYDKESYNKALILFTNLRLGFERAGNVRLERAAEYYYRVWERRRSYYLWRTRSTSGVTPWLGSLFLGSLTGYGERPVYLGIWVTALITILAGIYEHWFPLVVATADKTFASYWFFSFKVFCGRGFTSDYPGGPLLGCQVFEFTLGLIFISLLVGSVTRKLS
jgi:Pentapeptide repeats (9 copies)